MSSAGGPRSHGLPVLLRGRLRPAGVDRGLARESRLNFTG